MKIQLHTYIGKFKVLTSEFNDEPSKVKLTGFNKLNSNRYKNQATEKMARLIKTDSEVKVARLNNRQVQRLDAKLAKGLISLDGYRLAMARIG